MGVYVIVRVRWEREGGRGMERRGEAEGCKHRSLSDRHGKGGGRQETIAPPHVSGISLFPRACRLVGGGAGTCVYACEEGVGGWWWWGIARGGGGRAGAERKKAEAEGPQHLSTMMGVSLRVEMPQERHIVKEIGERG